MKQLVTDLLLLRTQGEAFSIAMDQRERAPHIREGLYDPDKLCNSYTSPISSACFCAGRDLLSPSQTAAETGGGEASTGSVAQEAEADSSTKIVTGYTTALEKRSLKEEWAVNGDL
ncbi:unnamed protein product [Caretta caretta]